MRVSILNPIPYLIAVSLFMGCHGNQKNTNNFQQYGNFNQVMTDSLNLIRGGCQNTEIDPTKDNIIKCKKGTVIIILKNSIADKKGIPVSKKVIIEIKESYSIADFITSNLQTLHHDGRILESAGMLWINIRADGIDSVTIKNRSVTVKFPVKEVRPGTQIFTGQRSEDGKITWNDGQDIEKASAPVAASATFRFPPRDTLTTFTQGTDTISFYPKKFGYVNVDFFYKDPKSTNIKLLVKANDSRLEIYLIIKGRKVVLSGVPYTTNKFNYVFTKNVDGYNKLPKGEKAIIIAFDYRDKKLRFAEKEITLGQNETEALKLRNVTFNGLKTILKKYEE